MSEDADGLNKQTTTPHPPPLQPPLQQQQPSSTPALVPKSPVSSSQLPNGMAVVASTTNLRDQLVAMLVSTHPRGGTHNDNSNNKWNHFHLALKVLWEWLMEAQSNVSLRVDSGKEVITFGFSPITGSITRGVTCWRDVRTGVTGKLVSVNTQNALHARQGNAGHYSWELTSLATGERVGLWEGADGSVKAAANEKWLLEWLERGSRLAIAPTCGMNAGSRRVVDVPQALVLPKFYLRSSSLNLFFNRAADDEAVLMFFGEARTQELPSLVSLRLVCITQTWATKSLTELSSTRSAVYTCPSSAVVCQSRLLGGAHTFVVITQHPDRRRYAAVIEEGTGRQTTLLTRVRDKGKVCYAMSLGQLSGSLFCIGYCDVDVADMHSTESRFFAFKMAGSSPTWYEIWDCNRRITPTTSPLRIVTCPAECSLVVAQGGLVFTVTKDKRNKSCCLQVTAPSSSPEIVVLSFRYPAHIWFVCYDGRLFS